MTTEAKLREHLNAVILRALQYEIDTERATFTVRRVTATNIQVTTAGGKCLSVVVGKFKRNQNMQEQK